VSTPALIRPPLVITDQTEGLPQSTQEAAHANVARFTAIVTGKNPDHLNGKTCSRIGRLFALLPRQRLGGGIFLRKPNL
jgi:hypothetical protein